MPVPTLPANMTEQDYEAIEGAVMETVRGRWFLMEFARRCRSQELGQIRETLARLERAMNAGLRQVEQAAAGERWGIDGPLLQAQEETALAEWQADAAAAPTAAVAPAPALETLDALPLRDKMALFA